MSPVQIQKAMFLMAKEAEREVGRGFYRFKPYNYGPFDAAIYDDLEELARTDLVAIEISPNRRWHSYSVTAAGRQRSAEIRESAKAETLEFLKRVVEWVCARSFSSLVRAIYEKYPEYRTNSVFVG